MDLLRRLAGEMGFELEVVEKIQEDSREISSTFIREEIQKGHIKRPIIC